MRIGTYYYPEQWPRNQWERDFDHMADMGMQIVHMGEFAWYFMEPEEGKYDFDWLERNVEIASRNGLKVILCTPSVLTQKFAHKIWQQRTRSHQLSWSIRRAWGTGS